MHDLIAPICVGFFTALSVSIGMQFCFRSLTLEQKQIREERKACLEKYWYRVIPFCIVGVAIGSFLGYWLRGSS